MKSAKRTRAERNEIEDWRAVLSWVQFDLEIANEVIQILLNLVKMPLSEEAKTRLKAAGREDLIKISEINDSGYAGVMPNGNIVDRREHPTAVPVQENELLGIPKPKPLP